MCAQDKAGTTHASVCVMPCNDEALSGRVKGGQRVCYAILYDWWPGWQFYTGAVLSDSTHV